MNARVGDTVVLTAGELAELGRRLAPTRSAELTAMTLGEPVDPAAAYVTLNVDLRFAAGEDVDAHVILDRATRRLERAHPVTLELRA